MKNLILIVIFLNASFGENYSLRKIYEGDKDGYINPKWATDSETFSVQTINSVEGKAANLWIYQVTPYLVQNIQAFPAKQRRKSGPQTRSINSPFELAMGWINWYGEKVLISSKNYSSDTHQRQVFYSYSHRITNNLEKSSQDNFIQSTNESGPMNFAVNSEGIIYFTLLSDNQSLKMIKLPNPDIVNFGQKFTYPIVNIAFNRFEKKLFIICGRETIYKCYLTNSQSDNFVEIDLPLDQFTILTESSFSNIHSKWIAILGSNIELRDDEEAVLNICDVSSSTIIKQITVFKHNQPSPLTRASYHQWHPIRDQIFYIKENDDEEKQLYFFDFLLNEERIVHTTENDIKTFNISQDGQKVIIISNEMTKNMRIYSLIDETF